VDRVLGATVTIAVPVSVSAGITVVVVVGTDVESDVATSKVKLVPRSILVVAKAPVPVKPSVVAARSWEENEMPMMKS